MIEKISVGVAEKRVSVAVKAYAVDLFRHRAVVDFYADDSDERTPPVDRDVVGDHALVQIVGDIRRERDGLALVFGHREPDQIGRVLRVVEPDVGDLVLHEALAVQVDVPEALDRVGDRRVDAVVIGQHTVGLRGHLVEMLSHPLHVAGEPLILQPVQIRLHEGRDFPVFLKI